MSKKPGLYQLALNDKTLTARSDCNTLFQSVSLSNSSANVSSLNGNSFNSVASTLSGAINDSAVTLSLDDTSGYSGSGLIMIDKEAIDYLTNNQTNNTLSGIKRGQAGTLASAHNDATVVSQFQCYFESIGTSPSSNVTGRSILHQANQLQTVVSVGAGQTLIQWNTPLSELSWESMSGNGNNVQFNAVDLLNAHEGWAVGNKTSNGNFSINQFSEGTWNSSAFNLAGINSQNLLAVSAVSSQEAWAVGDLDGNTTLLLKWNGASWSNTINNGTLSNLNDISVLDIDGDEAGNFGFAVGSASNSAENCSSDYDECINNDLLLNCQNYINTSSCYTVDSTNGKCSLTDDKKNYLKCLNDDKVKKCIKYIDDCTTKINIDQGSILAYDGSTWVDSSINSQSSVLTLNAVSLIPNGSSSPIDAYAAGESSSSGGIIVKWNSIENDWDILTTPSPASIMRSISIIDTTSDGMANYGWVVGDSGSAYQYNAGTWSALTTITTNDLFSVKVLSKTNAWASGANGARYHWNGTTWTQAETGLSTTQTLYGLGVAYAITSPSSGWQEEIN